MPNPSLAIDQLVHAADALYLGGNPSAARQKYSQALAATPQNPILDYRIGLCAWAEGNGVLAQDHFEQAIRLDPNYADAHDALGQLHLESGRLAPAEAHSAKAIELAPHDTDCAVSRAFVLEADRKTDQAWTILKGVLERGKPTVRLGVLMSRIAPQLKFEQHALDVLGRLLATRSFVNQLEERGLRYAAASLLDSMGRFDEAFNQAQLAARLRQARYDPRQQEDFISRQIGYFTRENLAALPRSSRDAGELVFIVGMPRSGTSLIEQILASHPAVFGSGEQMYLPMIADSAAAFLGAEDLGFPQCLDRLTTDKANDLADRYLQPMLERAPDAARITDKLPLNCLHLGLIAILFPNARVINCLRDPMDTCLSCFMTDFAGGHEFSFDLTNCGQYHRLQERLMAHWKSVLDLPIYDASYERLIEDPETQTRRLIEFVGLDWDPRCLRFHENSRYVGTASNIQVRKPLFKSSVGRWRNYEKHLGPLKAALRP